MRGFPLGAIALLASLTACRSAGGSSTAVGLQDDAGTYVHLRGAPRRIVSLNPTATELLYALGAGPRLVGRSRACNYRPAAADVPDLADVAQAARLLGRMTAAGHVGDSVAAALEAELARQSATTTREGHVVRLTESSSNRPSPRAPQAVRSLRSRLAPFTAPTPSGDSR